MNKYDQHFNDYFTRVNKALEKIDSQELETATTQILQCYEREGTIFIFGNGGSGATASHVAGDFLKGISYGLKKRFKVISFNDNMPAFSAIANDLSYDEVFIEQLKSYVRKEDLVIGISGSGNSVNVLKAIEYAKSMDVETIGLCGFKGGKLKEAVDHPVHVHINDMEVTEDVHMLIFHAIKQAIIAELKGDSASMGKTYDERVKDQSGNA